MPTLLTESRPALTDLSEQERMFQEAVRDFAAAEIAPRVQEMDREATMSRELVGRLFELGLMGIEISEMHGGTGADFFTSVLVVEELSKVDPSVGVFVDVQNTLVINALLRWATDTQMSHYLPRLASDTAAARTGRAAQGSSARCASGVSPRPARPTRLYPAAGTSRCPLLIPRAAR